MGNYSEVDLQLAEEKYLASIGQAKAHGVTVTDEVEAYLRHAATVAAYQQMTIDNYHSLLHPNAIGMKVKHVGDGVMLLEHRDIRVSLIDGEMFSRIEVYREGCDSPDYENIY